MGRPIEKPGQGNMGVGMSAFSDHVAFQILKGIVHANCRDRRVTLTESETIGMRLLTVGRPAT